MFDVGWDYIAAVLREDDAELYLCEGGSPFKLKILCHLVKIQKYVRMQIMGLICMGGCGPSCLSRVGVARAGCLGSVWPELVVQGGCGPSWLSGVGVA